MCVHVRRRWGFSLIELLVVVAILALLLGIMLPSVSAARREAMSVKCVSNLRQIVAGVLMYQLDNRDRFPITMETVSTGFPVTVSWWAIDNYQRAIEPYLQQDRGGVERDGRSRGKASVWFDPADPDAVDPVMWGSFSDNGMITGVPRRADEILRPAATVFATLREINWEHVVDVQVPRPPPVDDPDHPFWVSDYFDMCLDPWSETDDPADPYHWMAGRARPPASLFPEHPYASDWDEQIDGRFPDHPDRSGRVTRYRGQRVPFAFCDGHIEMTPFERTFADPDGNMWDIR